MRRDIEDLGDEGPVEAVLLLKRDELGVLLRQPEKSRCANVGVRYFGRLDEHVANGGVLRLATGEEGCEDGRERLVDGEGE
jgi:hypothetical protein